MTGQSRKTRDILGFKVKDLDAGCGGGTQPVSVGREDEGVDNVACLERVEVLALIEVPEHGNTVFATRSREGSVGGDRNCVDVARVSVMVGLQLEF